MVFYKNFHLNYVTRLIMIFQTCFEWERIYDLQSYTGFSAHGRTTGIENVAGNVLEE